MNEPICFFSVDPAKVVGFEIYGMNSSDNGAIKGAAMDGQKGYLKAVSKRRVLSDTPSA